NEITIKFFYNKDLIIPSVTGNLISSEGEFDVNQGIPTKENIKAKFNGKEYLINKRIIEETETINNTVIVKKKYNYKKWDDEDKKIYKKDEEGNYILDENGKKIFDHYEGGYDNKTKTIVIDYNISRTGTFYKIDNFEIYKIKTGSINNELLGEIEFSPNNYNLNIEVERYNSNIVSNPTVESIVDLGTENIGTNSPPSESSITNTWETYAENAVGEMIVKNDKLIIEEQTILNDNPFTEITPAPNTISEAPLKAFESNDYLIEETKENKEYTSTGKITYEIIKEKTINQINADEFEVELTVNSVKVHTPIVTDLLLSTVGDNYNQEINGDENARALILGMKNVIRYDTEGKHLNILGYGNRDYNEYIEKKEIKFPFDIYFDTDLKDNSKFKPKDTWITVTKEDTNIYVPTWVDEGIYMVKSKTTAINSNETLNLETADSNLDPTEYIVTDEMEVKIIGRLYGLRINDINDYPTWEEVFREKEGSYTHKEGIYYPVGHNDENGERNRNNPKYLLPIIPGSHPIYSNVGNIKTGYSFRYELKTIGNYKNNDKIKITPTFKYVDKEGNINKEINLWSLITDGNNEYLINLNEIENKNELREKLLYEIEVGDPYRDIT
ncbi:MAG: DUF5704 domain-containing protein, partial [Bacillota bacterium]|nr:DUF5704 domain-containing protein [Bacillota bacterium]